MPARGISGRLVDRIENALHEPELAGLPWPDIYIKEPG